MTGHPLGAAGALEVIFCLRMLEHNFIAPSINIETLDPNFEGWPIVTTQNSTKIGTILSNSFGFGGNPFSKRLAFRTAHFKAVVVARGYFFTETWM